MYPGPLAVAHSWAYLPDVAETMVTLAHTASDRGSVNVDRLTLA